MANMGVYVLAKSQALDFGWDNDKAIKWAVLRMKAFMAGWFDHQKYTMFKEVPPTFMQTFCKDKLEIMKYQNSAGALCIFIPLLAEFHFRAYGTNYQTTKDPTKYVLTAEKLAAASLMKGLVSYMDKYSFR